jgi:phage regulator Rha-like protein
MQLIVIQQKIYEIRGHRVMLDRDLAELFGTETRKLKQAVKRNIDRFPKDFMFKLTGKEIKEMVSQNVIPSKSYFGGAAPFAFTEHGVTMLANVLKSKKAIQMSIAIVRAFIALKQMAITYKDLADQINEIRQTVSSHSEQLNQIYNAIENMLDDKAEQKAWKDREKIGFKK